MDRADRHFSHFVLWISIHLTAYVAVAIAIRFLADHFGIVAIAAIRSMGSLAIAGAILARRPKGIEEITGESIRDDFQRSLVHLCGSLALIWSIAELPLAFVATVEFSGPLFAAAIAWFTLHKTPDQRGWLGLGLIATGVVLLMSSQNVATDGRYLMPVLAVGALTVSNILLARLAEKRSIASIIFRMHLIQLPLYLLIIALSFQGSTLPTMIQVSSWTPSSWLTILGAALVLSVAGFATQAALANASRHSTPLQLCAADLLRLPIIAWIGFTLFAETLSVPTILCGGIILVGSLILSLPRRLAQPVS